MGSLHPAAAGRIVPMNPGRRGRRPSPRNGPGSGRVDACPEPVEWVPGDRDPFAEAGSWEASFPRGAECIGTMNQGRRGRRPSPRNGPGSGRVAVPGDCDPLSAARFMGSVVSGGAGMHWDHEPSNLGMASRPAPSRGEAKSEPRGGHGPGRAGPTRRQFSPYGSWRARGLGPCQ